MDGGKFGSMINENLHELYQVKSKRGNKLNIPPLGAALAEERQGRFYHDGCQLLPRVG
jgi:hypothetical protein